MTGIPLAGVGPYRAKLMVDAFGEGVLDVMDMCDAADKLGKAANVKPQVAADIKQSWLKTRQSCEHHSLAQFSHKSCCKPCRSIVGC